MGNISAYQSFKGRCCHQVAPQLNQRSVLMWGELADSVYFLNSYFLFLDFIYIYTPSANIRVAAPGCASLFPFVYCLFFSLMHPDPSSLSLHSSHPLKSPSPTLLPDNEIRRHQSRGSPDAKTQLCGCPTFLSLNTPPANTSSTEFSRQQSFPLFSSLLFLPPPPPPLSSPLPSLTLPQDGSVKDKGPNKESTFPRTSVL